MIWLKFHLCVVLEVLLMNITGSGDGLVPKRQNIHIIVDIVYLRTCVYIDLGELNIKVIGIHPYPNKLHISNNQTLFVVWTKIKN